jgi:hypothetical protein
MRIFGKVFRVAHCRSQDNTFGDGNAQIFIPIWLQKSWNKITTYGGGGYWIRPGTGNKNSVFTGWELQYDFSKVLTLGGEVYYHSSETSTDKSVIAFNLGGFVNFSEKTHFIFSIGRNLNNDNFISAYLGILWTI